MTARTFLLLSTVIVLPACSVVSAAGTAVGTAASVAGAAVRTSASVAALISRVMLWSVMLSAAGLRAAVWSVGMSAIVADERARVSVESAALSQEGPHV